MKALMKICIVLLAASVGFAAMQVEITSPKIADYTATVVDDPIGIYDMGESFRTFCMERAESTDDGEVYNVELSLSSFDGGVLPSGTGDPMDARTAFLYREYLDGNLGGLGFAENYDSYWAMQNVIWHIEDEGSVVDLNSGLAGALLDYANNANAFGTYGIRVMVMTYLQGVNSQDMLVRVIPAPGAMILAGIGISILSWVRKRKLN